MTLPLGSDEGPYEVEIQLPGEQKIAAALGHATITAGTTILEVVVDLSGIPPGKYELFYRRVNRARHRISVLITQ